MKFKDAKKTFLIDVAIKLFLTDSIDKVTIKDIANEAGVGEMTIYRYFGKKQTIVKEAAIRLQNIVFKDYFNLDEGKSGYEKIKLFYETFLKVFISRPDFFKFIKEFDLNMMNEKDEDLQEYEDDLSRFKDLYLSAYQMGLKDKSIKEVKDVELFYFTSTHALMELCKKLSYSQGVLPQDNKIEKVSELKCLIETILNMIKNS